MYVACLFVYRKAFGFGLEFAVYSSQTLISDLPSEMISIKWQNAPLIRDDGPYGFLDVLKLKYVRSFEYGGRKAENLSKRITMSIDDLQVS